MYPQEGEFVQWFGDNLWALWGVITLVLASAEMLTLDLTLLMLASGALAGGVVAFFLPGLVWLQVIVALAVAAAMLGFLRPTLLRRVRNAPGYRSSLSKLVGSEGTATAAITRSGGEVKVNGEVWTARTMASDIQIGVGDLVEVYEVDGTTLVVYPVERELPSQRRMLED
ncbi:MULTISPECIES: NfeD family protein [unclassified Luteococcus]|uniref:NfeD family protein n=1 Tax=unclassified Luteococcus TaxID=2639923 RepID=UPI00313C1EF7